MRMTNEAPERRTSIVATNATSNQTYASAATVSDVPDDVAGQTSTSSSSPR